VNNIQRHGETGEPVHCILISVLKPQCRRLAYSLSLNSRRRLPRLRRKVPAATLSPRDTDKVARCPMEVGLRDRYTSQLDVS
jgi:hypothetical protein